MNLKLLSLGILLFLFSLLVSAQFRQGNHEITIGCGLITSDEALDGNKSIASSGIQEHYTYSQHFGTMFVDYKYYVNKDVTIGLFGGMERENGDIGIPQWNTDQAIPLGTFSRVAYTVATEVSVQYHKENNARVYATFGFGVTSENETDVIQQAYYKNVPLWNYYTGPLTGSETKVPNNRAHFNGYFSPVGISFGKRLRGFVEVGFGYKGVFNGGISYKVDRHRRSMVLPPDADSVIILPHTFQVEHLKDVGAISTEDEHTDNFNEGLHIVRVNTLHSYGNVFKVNKIKYIEEKDYYYMSGVAYYTPMLDSFRRYLQSEKNKKLQRNFARIVFYRPLQGGLPDLKMNINDTCEVEIRHGERSTYFYKITKEGKYKISGSSNDTVTIDVKFGNNYYVKVYFSKKVPVPRKHKPPIDKTKFIAKPFLMDNLQGELESSIQKHVRYKILRNSTR